MAADYFLKMEGISKSFPGVHALDNVDLFVQGGQIHAIVGENGAGKSTLMKILCGAYQKDSGEIWLNNNLIEIKNPLDAQNLGIAIIYQEFNLASHLTAEANIFIGREPTSRYGGFIENVVVHKNAVKLFQQFGVAINPSVEVRNLTVCEQQFVEIAKALSFNSNLLIMDEPTSALPEKEIQQLFRVIRRIKQEGVTILYISHCLDEVFEIADTVTILRDGKHIITKPIRELTKKKVISHIVGRELGAVSRGRQPSSKAGVLLGVEDLCQGSVLKNISFELHEGEILGIAGLLGAGRTELLSCIFGVNPKTSGSIYLNGRKCEINSPSEAVINGIGFVPEDRKLQGLFLGLNTRANITTAYLDNILKMGLIDSKAECQIAAQYIKSIDIRLHSQEQLALSLSGGNQQKVLLSRWLAIKPKILLLDDPTRGIDVGARASIHKLIYKLADQGLGVIFVSSELPEVLDICDRILVMAKGQVTGEYSHEEATREKILMCATKAFLNLQPA
ncbi:MAG TPA: sugar ABC transporter ATP-binding protein [Anaerolineae bacterium]|nr:sugar ABC transporter ATP-binding protein [Anaerolineae bacterium]